MIGPERPIMAPLFSPAAPEQLSRPAVLGAGRWSLSTWAFVRRGSEAQLATGGQLGGSQVGARALYRLEPRIALSARFYSPLNSSRGAEAALGIEVQPLRDLPVRILAERRQAIGEEGRSAFALLAHGGISERRVLGPVLMDAYAQAGVVGLKSRDGFVDGALRLGLPLTDRLSIGAGAWGAAQPGVSRSIGARRPPIAFRSAMARGSARSGGSASRRGAARLRPGTDARHRFLKRGIPSRGPGG
jgi:hypothetical protein